MDSSTSLCGCKDITHAQMGSDGICFCTDPNAYLDPSGICQCKDEWATINAGNSLCVCDDSKSMILTTGKVGYCGCKDASHASINHVTG